MRDAESTLQLYILHLSVALIFYPNNVRIPLQVVKSGILDTMSDKERKLQEVIIPVATDGLQ